MALISCSECGKEISSEAKACPNCGFRVPKTKKPKGSKTPNVGKIISICLLPLIIIGIFAYNGIYLKNRWKSVIDFTYIEYVSGSELFDDNGYQLYEVTNTSNKTLKNVHVRIKVVDFFDKTYEFSDYVALRLRPGETEEYKLSKRDVLNAAEEQSITSEPYDWDIVGFTYELD
jgi:DNA-directed RNA polymerase subunit RPC12/RpoP